MQYSRQKVVDLINSWKGYSESNGKYKQIIDIYNSYKPLPRGVKMQYNWPWCAATWSALAIKLGYTKIMPIEISCSRLIENAKKMGCWVENDKYVPKIGDAILYDWDDSASYANNDNKNNPDHVGTVISVNEKTGYIEVMEGNHNNAVKPRTVAINGKYIRGYICPKYSEENTPTKPKDEVKPSPEKPKEQSDKKKVVATESAKKFDKQLTGTYKTTANLNLRNGAGTNKKVLVLIPKNTKVQNFGYYTTVSNTPWYYIQCTLDGVTYVGFSSSSYLKKV